MGALMKIMTIVKRYLQVIVWKRGYGEVSACDALG